MRITEIAAELKKGVESCLEDRIAVSFSGGLDSSLIAHLAKPIADTRLITVGTPESEDMLFSRKASWMLGLGLEEIVLTEEAILDTYKKCHEVCPGDFLKVELLVPVYHAAKKATSLGLNALLFGSGAEELFVGYERYYEYHAGGQDLDAVLREEFETLKDRDIRAVRKVCSRLGVEARFPFYRRELAEIVFSVPLEERMKDRELKKGVLRDVGKLLGLPEQINQRKKKAMQYGSGVHRVLMKNREKLEPLSPAPRF
ncbi:MAG: asparagine synthase C-terminal domain-containing protein [Candidatus Bilamarchaeaceae archaeon]